MCPNKKFDNNESLNFRVPLNQNLETNNKNLIEFNK
jgi:hypothetical protein